MQFEFAARRSEIRLLEWDRSDSEMGGISKPISEEAYRRLSTAPCREGCFYVLPSPDDPTRRPAANTMLVGHHGLATQ